MKGCIVPLLYMRKSPTDKDFARARERCCSIVRSSFVCSAVMLATVNVFVCVLYNDCAMLNQSRLTESKKCLRKTKVVCMEQVKSWICA